MRRSSFFGLPFLLICIMQAGCRTTTGVAGVTVHVRDQQTHQPVANAVVQAETVHFFVPIYPYPIVDFNPSANVLGSSGSDGSVRMELPQDCPVRINIVAAGYEPLEAYVSQQGLWPQTGQWIDTSPELGDSCGPRLEVRFEP